MILYHITSLEKPIQSILIPKIPDETEIGENYTEKRICLAPSILECLKSAEIVNKFDDEVGLVRVYKVKINEDDPNLVGWNKLYEEGLVPDAALTHEYWYKKPIMPIECSVYRVSGWTKKEYIITCNYDNVNYVNNVLKDEDIINKTFNNLITYEVLIDNEKAIKIKDLLNNKNIKIKEKKN